MAAKIVAALPQERWWITRQEYAAMIAAARSHGDDPGKRLLNETMINLSFYLGLSPIESVDLRWTDVSLVEGTISIRGRGGEQKKYSLGTNRVELLRRLKNLPLAQKHTTYLYVPAHRSVLIDGKYQDARMSTGTLSRRLRTLAIQAGIKRQITPQMFRYGCGIHMARALVRPQDIREWLDYSTFNKVNAMVSAVTRSPEESFLGLE